MPQDFENLTSGLRVQTQIPLDVKQYSASENSLKNLGTSNNLAFTYIEGLIVYCIAEKTRWEWREVKDDEPVLGLIDNDYTYPDDINTFGIDYSNRTFNFFPSDLNTPGTQGPAGTITLGTVTTGTPGSNVIITNTGTSQAAILNFTIPRGNTGANGNDGADGANGIDASNNLQKTITGNYTLSNSDNNYTIIINNGATAINITVPTGLMENINIVFIQQGTANITFVQSGTIINSPGAMKKIKGQNFWAALEQVAATNTYQLLGALKT